MKMFIVGVDSRQNDDLVTRVQAARSRYDELQQVNRSHVSSSQAMDREPDLIVIHNTHWTLLNMGLNGSSLADLPMSEGSLLPRSYLVGYMEQLKYLSRLVREAFPTAPMLMHTAAMVRHDVTTGHTEGKRAWINRLFIDQLNQASRQVSDQASRQVSQSV